MLPAFILMRGRPVLVALLAAQIVLFSQKTNSNFHLEDERDLLRRNNLLCQLASICHGIRAASTGRGDEVTPVTLGSCILAHSSVE